MSKVEDIQLALAHLLEVLIDEDLSLDEAIDRIAPEYEVTPIALRSWTDRRFVSLEALDAWIIKAREAKTNRDEWTDQLSHLTSAANEWAEGVWKACEPDGQPDWLYCCGRFLKAHRISNAILKAEARQVFLDTGHRFNEMRLKYLSEQNKS